MITAPGTYTVTDAQSTTVYSVATAAGATLDITGGTFTADTGTGNDINAGAIRVEAGASLNVLAGSLTSTGALQIANGGTLNFGGAITGGALANSGTVNLTNGAIITGVTLANSGMMNVTSGSTSSLIGTNLTNTGTVGASLALDGSAYFAGQPTLTQNGNSTAGVVLTTTKAK